MTNTSLCEFIVSSTRIGNNRVRAAISLQVIP
jgi:hypothetical protein